jgi:hypothetical protein
MLLVDMRGYVIVSADSEIKPVLAFVERNKFAKGNAPGGAVMWLNKTMQNIELVRKGLYDNTNLAKAAWGTYYKRNQADNSNYSRSVSSNNGASPNTTAPPPPIDNPCQSDPSYSNSVTYTTGPLLSTIWGQLNTYNDLCPYKSCSYPTDGYAPTGCVATAMSQIIRYWESPSATYAFGTMPYDHGNTDVQQLMLDAGSSVSMEYNCSGSNPPAETWVAGGILLNESAAERMADAFKGSFFGYSSADYDNSYDGYDYSKIETDIGYSRPVILSGYGDRNDTWNYPEGEGHSWVCDGKSTTHFSFCMNGSLVEYTTLDFHMNWGWDGAFNGWFAFSNWTITADEGEDFQYFNELDYNIHP